jgi:methylated-DNA-[protein]-cysteine S-methyltransferase
MNTILPKYKILCYKLSKEHAIAKDRSQKTQRTRGQRVHPATQPPAVLFSGIFLMSPPTICVFSSSLGWMALVESNHKVQQLVFGHSSAKSALKSLDPEWVRDAVLRDTPSRLAQRLQAYAAGIFDNFRDIQIDIGDTSSFRRHVWAHCRRIPYGKTLSYAELARKAGIPGAARAVGNCMAANRVPLIIPCHRVVCSNGRLGSFSAPGSITMKRRLLTLEGVGPLIRGSQN